ncbi:hypothetical protein [Streptomyces alboflavus]|uniref:hypothetical protein n=1 Tax=Streptomyces alboflavus TaxID=67267 RepID=UPI00368FADC8
MKTFTFPTGATVELPDAMPTCHAPQADAEKEPVWCPAYTVATEIYGRRENIADGRRHAELLRAKGLGWKAAFLARNTDRSEERLVLLIGKWIAERPLCTCP